MAPGTLRLRQVGKPLGATFLGIAILVLVVGGRRYFESQVRGCFLMGCGSEGLEAVYQARASRRVDADGRGVVLDHPRQVPREQGQRVPDHFRGGGADRDELGGGGDGQSDAVSGELRGWEA